MNLHLDKNTFKQFINKIGIQTSISNDILEKDYYVCFILKEIALKQNETKAYFKGGTAVYKILDTMNRFSEDIDLTVKVKEGVSKNQNRKIFESIAFDYKITGLRLNKEKSIKKGKSEIAFYDYESVFAIDTAPLQRAGEIQIEATSFTVSEPVEDVIIEPMIYKHANEKEREILINKFDVKPIKIKTIKLERMFIDKIFATEFYYLRKDYTDTSKHIYDICVLLDNDKIQKLLKKPNEIKKLVEYKRMEERYRTGGVSENLKIRDFSYMKCEFDKEFVAKYESMKNKYIFIEENKIQIKKIEEKVKIIRRIFEKMDI